MFNSSSTLSMTGAFGNTSAIAPLNSSVYAESITDKSVISNVLNNTSSLTITGNNNQLANNSLIYVPQIRSKNSGEYLGILEWKVQDESRIINKLIDELKPRLAVTFLPGLPAYVLFMCIRYADMLNDDERVRSLLNSSVQSVKKLIKVKLLISPVCLAYK